MIKLKKMNFIELVLFFAVFNDFFRVPDTSITLFRVFLPFLFFSCFRYVKNKKRVLFVGMILLILYLVQNAVFCRIMQKGYYIDISQFGIYTIYFISIYTIVISVRALRVKEGSNFIHYFFDYIISIGYIYIFFFYLTLTPIYAAIYLANRNTYATGLAAVFPLYIIKASRGSLRNKIVCVLIMVGMYIGDCKAALVGVIIQLGIFTIILFMRRVKESKRYFVLLIGIVIIIAALVVNSPLTINAYSIEIMYNMMKSHILKMELFSTATTSVTFRTNAIIILIQLIIKSRFIGVGIGNTSIYLAEMMREIIWETLKGAKSIAPHFGLLEFYSDFGLLGIVITLIPFVCALKKLLNGKKNDRWDHALIVFTLSFPMWSMSASGIYTVYYIFVIIAYFLEVRYLKRNSYILEANERSRSQ